ncbi:MAG: transposase [Imperialibacter sp.]|uniref:REP-associated tyrosine transposase n=2 Tax=Imperialibacter sp. TaxID=2038411 RepID=UPI0032EC2B87
MSELRKATTDHPYFLSIPVVGWIDVFTRQRYCDKIIESLTFCTQNKGLEIFAYVIMPSHLHMVARSLKSDLNHIVRDFKSFTSKEIIKQVKNEPGESRKEWMIEIFQAYAKRYKQNTNYMFWQKTNFPVELSYPAILDQKIDYIHRNPVAAGYVIEPEAWYYSSACPLSPLKVSEL